MTPAAAVQAAVQSATRQQIVHALCPPVVVETVYQYAHGRCVHFAVALARRLGVTVVVGFRHAGRFLHWAVSAARGNSRHLLDAYGRTSVAEIERRYMLTFEAVQVPLDDLIAHLGPRWEAERASAEGAVEVLSRYFGWTHADDAWRPA